MVDKHYSGLNVLSYNAICSFVNTTRTYGKTWTFKKRAFKRGIKKGKKTLWVRRFKKEVQEATSSFYTSSDLQKFCGIEWYDPQTKTGNLKQVGRTFYCKYAGKWRWFLKVCAVSDANAMRSADDVDCDTMIFDEYTTTPDRYKRYKGNEVKDFLDMFWSAKREHEVRCIFLGNKEGYTNPYLQYFGIDPLPVSFDGIRTYRHGSIVVEQRNIKTKQETEYDKKLYYMMEGTSYGNYIYNNEVKDAKKVKVKRTPPDALEYIQLNFNGREIRITSLDGYFYLSRNVDKQRRVYCDTTLNKYKNEGRLVKRNKKLFIALEAAISDNRVYYDSPVTYEAVQPFYTWLNI